MSLKAVLFDAAGTLIEVAEPVGETYARCALAFGAELPASRIEEAFHRILAAAPGMAFPDEATLEGVAARERGWWRDVVRGTFRAADSTARFRGADGRAGFEALFDALWLHYTDPAAWRLRPGAGEALDRLREAGLRIGLVSNFDGRLPGLLEGLGLARHFDAVALPRDAGAAKPDPRIFRIALARLGVAAEEACYVGDHATQDLAGARGAGLRAIDVAEVASLSELPHRLLSPAEEPR